MRKELLKFVIFICKRLDGVRVDDDYQDVEIYIYDYEGDV